MSYSTDKVTTTATVSYLSSIAFTQFGLLAYVMTNSQLFTINVRDGTTLVLAGSGSMGFADGQGTAAMC